MSSYLLIYGCPAFRAFRRVPHSVAFFRQAVIAKLEITWHSRPVIDFFPMSSPEAGIHRRGLLEPLAPSGTYPSPFSVAVTHEHLVALGLPSTQDLTQA